MSPFSTSVFSDPPQDPWAPSHWLRRLAWEDIDEKYLDQLIELAKSEDFSGYGLKGAHERGAGIDVSAECVSENRRGVAQVVARQSLIICGLPLIDRVVPGGMTSITKDAPLSGVMPSGIRLVYWVIPELLSHVALE